MSQQQPISRQETTTSFSTSPERAFDALRKIIAAFADVEFKLGEAADTAIEHLIEVTGADAAALAVPAADGDNEIEIIARRNLRGARTVSSTALQQAMAADHPEALVTSPPKSASVRGAMITSILCIPVHRRGKNHAAIYLDRRGLGAAPFDDVARQLGVCVGRVLAPILALINQHYIDRQQRRAAEERAEEALQQAAHMTGFYRFDDMVTNNQEMTKVLELAEQVADYDVDVLLLGETGTGKEYMARALHHESSRSSEPFIAVNCAALPEPMLENELFGHEPGSYTGADNRYRGKFEQAHGGILFLDEIGELPLEMQAKLLRAIEQKRICRLGGSQYVDVDVRIIASTNRDLKEAVEADKFREDLFYRLNRLPLHLPPLRERLEDIPHLARNFLELESAQIKRYNVTRWTDEALRRLADYSWPGNLRELRNVVSQLVVKASGPAIELQEVEDVIPKDATVEARVTTVEGETLRGRLRDFERRLIETSLERWGSISGAARKLGLSRQALQQRCRKFGLESPYEP